MIAKDGELIETIVRRIVEASHPDKVVLFGSRARGDSSGRSDYDLLVIMESTEPGFRRDAPIYLALRGVSAPVDVLVHTPQEISDWSAVPQAFVTMAMREGKVLYERQR
jgi:uncharacterized protein